MSIVPSPRRKPPRPTVVCLVRHGTTATTGKVLPGQARGLHLSDQGLAEAAKAAESLSCLKVSALYASPLERTRETALAISERVGKPVVAERGLLECDFGDLDGRVALGVAQAPRVADRAALAVGVPLPGGRVVRRAAIPPDRHRREDLRRPPR